MLHIDWPGYGDSAGEPTDSGIAEAWVASVGAAVEALRLQTGVSEVAWWGCGSGRCSRSRRPLAATSTATSSSGLPTCRAVLTCAS